MNKIPKPISGGCYLGIVAKLDEWASGELNLILALLHAVHDDGSVGVVDGALGDIKEYAPHLIVAAQQEQRP